MSQRLHEPHEIGILFYQSPIKPRNVIILTIRVVVSFLRATALIAHHERRLSDTAGARPGGAATAYEVARQLRWTSRGRHLDEMDAFNQMLAVMETVAHLDVLRAQGRATRSQPEGDPWVYAV